MSKTAKNRTLWDRAHHPHPQEGSEVVGMLPLYNEIISDVASQERSLY